MRSNAILDTVKAILQELPQTNEVQTKQGGVKTWVLKPRPLQAFVQLQWTGRTERQHGVGPQADRFTTLAIDMWMPFSYENPDTTIVWNDFVDDVCDKLRSNMSLRNNIVDSGYPQVRSNDHEAVSDGVREAVRCHHCTIVLTLEHHFSFTTT
jgi:hypothetical protein